VSFFLLYIVFHSLLVFASFSFLVDDFFVSFSLPSGNLELVFSG